MTRTFRPIKLSAFLLLVLSLCNNAQAQQCYGSPGIKPLPPVGYNDVKALCICKGFNCSWKWFGVKNGSSNYSAPSIQRGFDNLARTQRQGLAIQQQGNQAYINTIQRMASQMTPAQRAEYARRLQRLENKRKAYKQCKVNVTRKLSGGTMRLQFNQLYKVEDACKHLK